MDLTMLVHHFYHKANQRAYVLTNFGYSSNCNNVFYELCSIQLSIFLVVNVFITTPHLVSM